MILNDVSQAAAVLNCTERWLADQVRAGKFPARKIARRLMFTDTDIAAILEICAVSPYAISNADTGPGPEIQSSMTPTTLRRLQQSSHPP